MAISDVRLNGNYYELYDGSGKKTKETHKNGVGELCGSGMDFVVFLNGNYYATYDENLRKIKESHKNSLGEFKNVAGSSINFVNGACSKNPK
jgi:hypothetical protein